MATDYVHLLDRRTAELIVLGTPEELATIVESRANPLQAPRLWQEFYDHERQSITPFPADISALDRLQVILKDEALPEVKRELIRELCMGEWLNVDYWGCSSEVFESGEPPDAVIWEDFFAPAFQGAAGEHESSCLYLLTSENTRAMLQSLRNHADELTIMGDAEVAKLQRWHNFCLTRQDFCVCYQVDF